MRHSFLVIDDSKLHHQMYRLIFSRGTDSHDYKFSSAVLEDYGHTTGAWRDRFLAASIFWLKGSGGQETPLCRRIRAALGSS